MKAKLFSEIKYYKEDQHMNNQPIKSDEKRRSCRTLHFSGNLQHLSFIFDDFVLFTVAVGNSVTRVKSPIIYKSCPKMISLEKIKVLTLLKFPKNGEIWAN